MNSKLVMSGAAIALSIAGIACLFLHQEIFMLYNPATQDVQGLLVQLLGAGFFGFAALDWASRQAPLGGIYGRPVVSANHTHFVIGSLLIVKAVIGQANNPVLWFTLAVYVPFAIAFSIILFGPPPKKDTVQQ